MTVNVSNTATTNTWEYWRTRTNELAYAQTYRNVTVGSNTAIGDASISGTFSGGDLVANNTTTSTTNATGALVVKGGAGIAENLNVGGTFDLDGTATLNANTTIAGIASFTSNVNIDTTSPLRIGTGGNIQLLANSTVSQITEHVTGELNIEGYNINLATAGGGYMVRAMTGGATKLYHATAEKFETNATGVNVEGQANVDSLAVHGTADINGTMTFRTPADIAFDDLSGNELQFVRVNSGGTGLEYSNSIISNLSEVGDVLIGNALSLANGHVLAYNETSGQFENYPRDLLDSILFQDLDNVDGSGSGSILVKTIGATGLTGTANGYVAGRLDNVSETTLTSQTGTTLTYSSNADSHIQVFQNGVKLVPTTDFTANTTAIQLTNAVDTSDIVQVVEFDPTAIVASDGTSTDLGGGDFSDMRLKEGITEWTHSEDVYNLNAYTYYWKDKDRFHDRQEVGFIAQELEDHVPQVVTRNAYGERMVDYGKMTAVLLSMVKEQKSEIENLKTILLKNGIE